MAIYKTISSQTIIRKIFRDLRPDNDNWIDDAVEWIGEALEHIGASTQLIQKQCVLDITNYKVSLPADLYYINMVAKNGSISSGHAQNLDSLITKVSELKEQIIIAQADGKEYSATTTVLHEINNRIVVLENVYFENSNSLQPLQYGASVFHRSLHCDSCVNENAEHEDTYIIDANYIKTSFESGKICISYKAIPTDDDCFPLVPDDISYREAMFWYVYKKLLMLNPKFKNNGIDYAFAEERWQNYCTQARNAANYPDIDRYESFMNQWVRLIPNMSRHDDGFESLNTRENINRG